jgi:hypothetical protein
LGVGETSINDLLVIFLDLREIILVLLYLSLESLHTLFIKSVRVYYQRTVSPAIEFNLVLEAAIVSGLAFRRWPLR